MGPTLDLGFYADEIATGQLSDGRFVVAFGSGEGIWVWDPQADFPFCEVEFGVSVYGLAFAPNSLLVVGTGKGLQSFAVVGEWGGVMLPA
jgi:hypothetical protein